MTLFQKKKPSLYDVPSYYGFRQMLCARAEENGDSIAVKYKTKNTHHDVTYTELLSKVDALGTGLMRLPSPPKRAAVVASDGFPGLLSILTLLCSDAVVLPIDASLPFSSQIGILNHSDCDAVFFEKSLLPEFTAHRKALPRLKTFICIGLKEHEEDAENGVFSFTAISERGSGAQCEGDESFSSLVPEGEDDKLLLYKNGGVDTLLGVVFSLGALNSAARGFLQLNVLEGRCLSVLPFDHPFELCCCLLSSLYSGATLCLGSGLKSFGRELAEYAPDYLMLPPLYVENVWQKLIRNFINGGKEDTFKTLVKTGNALRRIGIDKRRTFFSKIHELLGGNLKRIYVGGAPINPDAVRFFDDVGIEVLGTYGLYECCGPISASRGNGCDPEGAGIILPCLQIMIDSPDDGGTGEICVMGETLMRGYYKNEEKTREAVDPSGWLHTGDLGRIDQTGQIFITGKLGNTINLKIGRSVHPEEIEGYLLALPDVTGAKVYAGKDSRGAELHLCADVTVDEARFEGLSSSQKAAAIKERLDRLNDALPPHKRVKTVRVKKTLG